MTDKNDVQSQAILANLESSGNRFGPRGTISFMDKDMFKSPIQGGYVEGIKTLADKLAQSATATALINEGAVLPETSLMGNKLDPEEGAKALAKMMREALEARKKYKHILIQMNDELKQGPLKGIVLIIGLKEEMSAMGPLGLRFRLAYPSDVRNTGTRLYPSFKTMNRMKAYKTYFELLCKKYMTDILNVKEPNPND